MLITKIILQDYGVYAGRNEFDFTCTREKPVVLVGGTNGAGKTTLFESIMLCLYGISFAERRASKKSYEAYLAKKIHRYRGKKAKAGRASVTVQFKFAQAGMDTEYKISRTWGVDSGELHEQLYVSKRHGKEEFVPLDVVEEAHWQSFIRDLVPKGVANLFFFDGERIVQIAREGNEDFAIKDSFKSLLGLDVVEQLHTDLQVNLVRSAKGVPSTIQDDYEKLKQEKEQCVSGNAQLHERLAQKRSEFDRLAMQAEAIKERITRVGGDFAAKRDEATARLAAKKAEHSEVQRRIQENCMGSLPFSLIPDKTHEVVDRIGKDRHIRDQRVIAVHMESKFDEIRKFTESGKLWDGAKIGDAAAKKIRDNLDTVLRLDQTADERGPTTFEDSVFSYNDIENTRADAEGPALEKLGKDTKDLVRIQEEVDQLEASLVSAAGDDEVGPLVSESQKISSESGQLLAEIEHIEKKMVDNGAMSSHLDKKMRGLVEQMFKDEKSATKAALTGKVQDVLEKFSGQIKAKKLKLLEGYLLEATQTLLHKKDFVQGVAVDPDTFSVSLFGAGGTEIPKDILSEGEKQMFATSVLWALAKTSGRPLPFIIDTPLARLDEGHRTNLVEKFLPSASHQTLIFSTDKEIEFEYFKSLKPYLSRSYVMVFSHEDGATKCHDGYFWNEKGEKIVASLY